MRQQLNAEIILKEEYRLNAEEHQSASKQKGMEALLLLFFFKSNYLSKWQINLSPPESTSNLWRSLILKQNSSRARKNGYDLSISIINSHRAFCLHVAARNNVRW